MKRFITILMMLATIGVTIPMMSTSVEAQTRRAYATRTKYVYVKKPSFYRRHRKAINIAAGTGVGMLMGGLIGHGKGAVIGGLLGAGGGAYFTHKQRPKNYTRYYYSRP